jgi:hypothetical protein
MRILFPQPAPGADESHPTAARTGAPALPDERLQGTLLSSQIGIARYQWQEGSGTLLYGHFALPSVYGSQVALELAEKTEGDPGQFAGAYRVTTYAGETRQSPVFARGTLTLTKLPDSRAGEPSDDVFTARWVLVPSDPQGLGYVAETSMIFRAVGMATHDQSQLIIAWDNANFARAFRQQGNEVLQYGIHGTQVVVPAPEG